MKRFLEGIVSLVLGVVMVGAVGMAAFAGVTVTSVEAPLKTGGQMRVFNVEIQDITSGSNGVGTVTLGGVRGTIHKVISYPVTSGAWPLSAWDCKLTDARGFDLMGGALMDRINTAPMQAFAWTVGSTHIKEPWVLGTLFVNCSALGTGNAVGLDIYIENK